jgi:putative tricarboxylic transport membrane protein
MFDLWVMLAFGIVGFAMERWGMPLGPFVIGLVLAPIAEKTLRSGLMKSAGDYSPLVTRPISLTFLIIGALLLAWPFFRQFMQWLRGSKRRSRS